MIENADEYWAEGTQSWFDATIRTDVNDGHNTREKLKRHDPWLSDILAEVCQVFHLKLSSYHRVPSGLTPACCPLSERRRLSGTGRGGTRTTAPRRSDSAAAAAAGPTLNGRRRRPMRSHMLPTGLLLLLCWRPLGPRRRWTGGRGSS